MYIQHGSDYTLYISLPYNTRATKNFVTLKLPNSSSTSEVDSGVIQAKFILMLSGVDQRSIYRVSTYNKSEKYLHLSTAILNQKGEFVTFI